MKPIPIFTAAAAVLVAGSLLAAGGSAAIAGNDSARPDEVVAKVRKAAALLSKKGAGVLEILRDDRSEFTWKDTYVFVVDCDADQVLANPAFPDRQGGDIKQHVDYVGTPYGLELCRTAQRPGGGWVEYVWLRPDGDTPLRKVSFVMSAEGRPYQVGAGVYEPEASLEELTAIANTSR